MRFKFGIPVSRVLNLLHCVHETTGRHSALNTEKAFVRGVIVVQYLYRFIQLIYSRLCTVRELFFFRVHGIDPTSL